MDLELLELDYDRRGLAREIRLDEDAGPPRVRGYAAVFDQETELWPGYHEVIRPGAFRESLAGVASKKALWNHQSGSPLGSTSGNPPLRVWEDAHGLGFEFEPPDTQAGRELVVLLRRGIVDGASFGFRALEAPENARKRNTDAGVVILRELRKVVLFEISPVSFPAYAGTEALLRRFDDVSRRALTDASLRPMLQRAPRGFGSPERAAPRRERLAEILEASRL